MPVPFRIPEAAQRSTLRKSNPNLKLVKVDPLVPLRAWFDSEISRLVAKYERRIKAGEFEQWSEAIFPLMRLEQALQSCAPCSKDTTALLVLAVSPHRAAAPRDVTRSTPGPESLWGAAAAHALAHDLLDEAARRGWIKQRADWGAIPAEGEA